MQSIERIQELFVKVPFKVPSGLLGRSTIEMCSKLLSWTTELEFPLLDQ